MSLSDRLLQPLQRDPASPAAPGIADDRIGIFAEVKDELHRRLVDRLDLKSIEALSPERVREEIRSVVVSTVSGSQVPLSHLERERLVQDLLDEVTGLGPLEPLLRDQSISDILVNTCSTIYVERAGKLELTRARFDSNEHLLRIITRIVSRVGRRVDETSPMVDARLPDGSRVNAIIPPLAIDGPVLSIRRFGRSPLRVRELLTLGTVTKEAIAFLGACVSAKLNVVVSGGTGTGKTTFLNTLSAFVPRTERIVTIEDSAELLLQQPHVVRLETRPANIEGKGEILARDLVRNSLRMRPDRIIIGEVRGAEVLDMLQAMNTGHEGSMTTIHANSPRDALARLEAMMGMGGVPISETATRQMISRAVHLLVHLTRGTDGRRRLASICEVTGTEGATISMQEIFQFQQRGTDAQGRILGDYAFTGIRPLAMEQVQRSGIDPAHILEKHLRGA